MPKLHTDPNRERLNSKVYFTASETTIDKLEQIKRRRGPSTSRSDIIREAVAKYLAEEEEQIGSSAHFSKRLEARLKTLLETQKQQTPISTDIMLETILNLLSIGLMNILPNFVPENKGYANSKTLIEMALTQTIRDHANAQKRVEIAEAELRKVKKP